MARGSKPGERRGGRKKGTPNKITTVQREIAAATGELPCDYMLRIMRDKSVADDRRDRMAAAAAPFYHPKFANVEHTGKDGGPIALEFVSGFGDGSQDKD